MTIAAQMTALSKALSVPSWQPEADGSYILHERNRAITMTEAGGQLVISAVAVKRGNRDGKSWIELQKTLLRQLTAKLAHVRETLSLNDDGELCLHRDVKLASLAARDLTQALGEFLNTLDYIQNLAEIRTPIHGKPKEALYALYTR